MKYIKTILIFIIMAPCLVSAQDTITMVNGKVLVGKAENRSTETIVRFTKITKRNKEKLKGIYKAEIYSVRYSDGQEQMIYAPNEELGYDIGVKEMGAFVEGEICARRYYKAPWITVGGVVGGMVGVYTLGFWGLIAPATYSGTIALIPVNTKHKKYLKDRLGDDYFIGGFKTIARRKKINNAVIGSAAGTVVMGIFFAILTSQHYYKGL